MKKKVLIDISGRSNSGPVIAIELAKALAQNGCDVYAVVAQDALNLEDWLRNTCLKDVYIVKTYTSMKDVIPSSIKFQMVEKAKIRAHYKDIIFDYVFKPIFHIWSEGIASQVNAKKIITLCHDPIMHSGESKIKQMLYKRHVKNSDEIVVLTRSFIPIVCHNYGFDQSKVHFMPHGLMKVYKERQDRTVQCLYEQSNINFMFFGRIEKYKGIEILMGAFKKLNKKYNNITLTIAGKGDMSEFGSMAECGKKVRVNNHYIPDEQVGCYFDGPNIVTVLPYLDATQSGVIPIAIEYGTPVIASDTGGLKEQMLDGKFGVYVKPGDIDDLAEKMEYFIHNSDLFDTQRAVMKNAMKELEWSEVVRKLLMEI